MRPKADLFYGVHLPRVKTEFGKIFSRKFVASCWEYHVRENAGSAGRYSSYLSLVRLSVAVDDEKSFKRIRLKGLQKQKMSNTERQELKTILHTFGLDYVSPGWYLTVNTHTSSE